MTGRDLFLSRARILELLCEAGGLEPARILELLETGPWSEPGSPARLARVNILRAILRDMAAKGLARTDGFDRWSATDFGHQAHLRASRRRAAPLAN
jgi:hypothetical protein